LLRDDIIKMYFSEGGRDLSSAVSFWKKQRWVMPMCFFISLLLTVGSIVMCRIRGFSDMTGAQTFDLGADIVSLGVCTVLLYSLIRDKNNHSENTRTRLKEMVGGKIIIESKIGEGTVATVELPKEGQINEDTVS